MPPFQLTTTSYQDTRWSYSFKVILFDISLLFHYFRAPNVFFEGEELANLDSELARSRQLKCSVCSRRGAALGCFLPRCRHTYHYACSRQLEGCRFDEV